MKLNLNPISAIADTADKIISRFKASPEEKAKAQLDQYEAETHRLEVTQDERTAEHAERMARLKIEQAVAQSKEAAKIRPRLGNVCIGGFIIMLAPYAAYTILMILDAVGVPINADKVENLWKIGANFPKEMIYTLLMATLGQGTLRTIEKAKGVEANRG